MQEGLICKWNRNNVLLLYWEFTSCSLRKLSFKMWHHVPFRISHFIEFGQMLAFCVSVRVCDDVFGYINKWMIQKSQADKDYGVNSLHSSPSWLNYALFVYEWTKRICTASDDKEPSESQTSITAASALYQANVIVVYHNDSYLIRRDFLPTAAPTLLHP